MPDAHTARSPWLSADDAEAVADLLRSVPVLADDERVLKVARAGQGNMNLTLRVTTDRWTLIVKQSRPWVEKYPQIAAPVERSEVEASFYQRVHGLAGVADRMPTLLAHDASTHVLVMEDLGESSDLSDAYAGRRIEDAEIVALASYLATLHALPTPPPEDRLTNRAMRALNHAHQYVIPLQQDNGLDLDAIEPGLAQAACEARKDPAYAALVEGMGQRYLADGDRLLHGDFFPGSWLRSDAGLKVIDPEFAYHGDREYDLGVAVAHLVLAGPNGSATRLIDAYPHEGLDHALLGRYAAGEVMRRLIGYAQLPLSLPPGGRAALLRRAVSAMKQSTWEAMC